MAQDQYKTLYGTTNPILKNESLLDMNRVVQRRINGTDIFHGAIVGEVGETFPDIDLAAEGELWLGFVWRHSNPADIPEGWLNPSATTPVYIYADNVYVDVVMPHGGALEVGLFMSPRTTSANDIAGNESLKVSATTDGMLDLTTTPAYPLVVGKASSDRAITPGETDALLVDVRY